jgi:hypothetical protein
MTEPLRGWHTQLGVSLNMPVFMLIELALAEASIADIHRVNPITELNTIMIAP